MAYTVDNVYTAVSSQEDTSHQAVSSYFIGPQAENLQYFKDNLDIILEEQRYGRETYFPEDGHFITPAIQASKTFRVKTKQVKNAVRRTAQLLAKHSLPFWSPRYQAHMCTDMSMPALLGYFMTMIYNPNNVSIEASPLTTVAELEVGDQLCEIFGYNIDDSNHKKPRAWGHITCDGTVANLESIWVARNLKFYPFSIRNAMQNNGPLSMIEHGFQVEICKPGPKGPVHKLLKDLTTWELLNLKVETILDIPDRLYREYNISSTFLGKVMEQYSVQSTSKTPLEEQYKIEKPIQYLLSSTRHYSWPKGCAVTGIGSDNVIGIQIDHGARVDINALDKHLENCVKNEQAIYAVVAIIGSTEEGCVDPLYHIVKLRDKYQAQGLSFVVHADAAWGGYFATMLPKDMKLGDILPLPLERSEGDGFVPDSSLRADTQTDLFALRFSDSVTVDPHKAGYIPYPAGGLCYRDQRMRYLVTWSSPYITKDPTTTSIGIYGIEGSKPGAAAMSAWLSNKCIGMTPEGYGALLGEVTWSCSRLAAEWSAMSTPEDDFIVVPLNMLPSELADDPPEKVEAEKKRIRDEILCKTNKEIVDADVGKKPSDSNMALLRALGSDLNINAFTCNFRYPDGTLNDDIEEANYLNKRIAQILCVDSPSDDPTAIPMYLSSTEFAQHEYGECNTNFKKRLGLPPSEEKLFVLRNVVMSPFPTDGNFISKLAAEFRTVVKKEVKICQERNRFVPDYYDFVIQGTHDICLVHLPKFHLANHRQQVIVSAELSSEGLRVYQDARTAHPKETFILRTIKKEDLPAVIEAGDTFKATILKISGGVNTFRRKSSETIVKEVDVTINRIIKSRPLNFKYRDLDYPSGNIPFYLYGTKKDTNIDHVLVQSPNTQISADAITLKLDKELNDEQLAKGLILHATRYSELAMQPFPSNKEIKAQRSFVFQSGRSLQVDIFEDPHNAVAEGPGLLDLGSAKPIATGLIKLGGSVYVDSDGLNDDPYFIPDDPAKFAKWKAEFDRIGEDL